VNQKVEFLFNKLGIVSDRTKNITRHVLMSFLYKGGSIATNFLIVPLTIHLLDAENYGIWLTLSSFIGWFSFFDVGLGHGLRNKFAEAKAKGDLTLARAYISTAYFSLGILSLTLIILFCGFNFFLDWARLFNVNSLMLDDLRILLPLVFSFFCLQLVLKLITTIYTSDQHHSIQVKVTFYSSVLSLISIWLMTKCGKQSLLIFSITYSLIPFLLLMGLNIFAFSFRFKKFKPSFGLWKVDHLKDILGLGMYFFLIQISIIILFSTDNIIISQLFGPKEVVPFNIAYKYMSISTMILSIFLAPYWSATTDSYIKKDIAWIKTSLINIFKISLGSILFIFLLVLLSPYAYKIWVGEDISIPLSLTSYMALFFSITILYAPFNQIINGIGKVKIQVYSFGISAIVNVPLSIFLAKNIGMGVSGVILSTILCTLPQVVLFPIQYFKIINNRADGIWNR
jgi:O-antigen/teichoic acid export membrane protein